VPFNGLVVVDGKEVRNDDGNAFNRIKADEIESVNVLKGETAVKQYGDRGKSGVIQIILKKK
jgi:bla regulator protein BlaR1